MVIRKYSYFVLIILLSACGQHKNTHSDKDAGTTNAIASVPSERKEINKMPAASYLVGIGDPKLDRKFGVEVFETPFTFKYLLAMQYDGMLQSDTLKIPDFGTWPIVQVRKGEDTLSCIIGFLDRQKEFKEYKLLIVQKGQLQLKVLKRYIVGSN